MDDLERDFIELVRSLGGPTQARKVADGLLLHWIRGRGSADFGVLVPLVSARAVLHIRDSIDSALGGASVRWMQGHGGAASDVRAHEARRLSVFLLSDTDRAPAPGTSRARSSTAASPAKFLPEAEIPERVFRDLDSWFGEREDRDPVVEEAVREIWKWPMFTASAAAAALGSKPTNRERVRSLRASSTLLGLPHGSRYLFPAFQFDPKKRSLRPAVSEVNRKLDSAHDPWGVASWWVSPNAWLPDSSRPADLLGTTHDDSVVQAARADIERDTNVSAAEASD